MRGKKMKPNFTITLVAPSLTRVFWTTILDYAIPVILLCVSLIAFAVAFLFYIVLGAASMAAFFFYAPNFMDQVAEIITNILLISLLVVGVIQTILYFSKGKSIGKRMTRLVITTMDGNKPTNTQLLKRWLLCNVLLNATIIYPILNQMHCKRTGLFIQDKYSQTIIYQEQRQFTY